MSDKKKDTGANNAPQNSNTNNQDKPQSYGTETVLKGLNPFRPMSYGTERIVQSKRYVPDVEKSDE